jgi:hypothetical protein
MMTEQERLLRGLLRECYDELRSIEAITVSPTPVDGLVELLARVRSALDQTREASEHERIGASPV